jgi:hypothetical protein
MAYDTQIDDAPPALDAEDAVHAEALERFDDIIQAVQEERAMALADRRFVSIAGAQWEGDWAAQFENSIMVEVNKTAQGVEKIVSDYRANRVTVNFRGVSKDSSEETAKTLNGMFRADLYASKGQQAADNAFEEAVQGGIGAWRLTNRYVDEYDPDSDEQRICIETIVDADQSVFWDTNAKLYDKSDADFGFVISAMSRQAFEKTYGADKASDWPQGITKPYYDWYTPDVVRVAEYYVVECKTAVLRIFQHRATGEDRREWASDLTPQAVADMIVEGWIEQPQRRMKRHRVRKYVLSGCDILEPGKLIAGTCIPIVPVYGKRWFIDNMERSRGHVRLAKDPQRIYNAQISKLTETASLAATERPIFTPEQVAGHETSWAQANINRAPYALINTIIGPDGMPMVSGPIGMVTPPQLSPVLAALIQITASDIAELTTNQDGADEAMSNVSAEAMDIAATRTDAKAFTYMDNMRQSMQRCGEIYLSMARDVYVEDGREVETMDERGEDGTAVLGEPATDDAGRYRIRNDISRGKYKVISDVTEATTTRRDKTVKTLVNMAQIAGVTDPELASAALATALINMDGEGMEDLQSWQRSRMVAQGVIKPTKEEQAELDQAQQQQQPDPQAAALAAVAQKEGALAIKAGADTELSKAKTVLTLAQAHSAGAEADQAHIDAHHAAAEHKMGMIERLKGLFAPAGAK